MGITELVFVTFFQTNKESFKYYLSMITCLFKTCDTIKETE